MDDHQESEHVPWSELLAEPSRDRHRTVYGVGAAVAALALVVMVARAVFSSPGPVVLAPESTSGSTIALPGDPVVEQGSNAGGEGSVLQEADLMAFSGSSDERAAVARAEWFVTDYFTADLEPSGSGDVRSALPSGSELPPMPQDSAGGLSYVEWARAFRVVEKEEGLFLVGVAFRSLGAPPDRGFFRLAVRAVEVEVKVTGEGGAVVVDLPSPVSLPVAPEPDPWPEGNEEAPQHVVDQALSQVAGWGGDPRLVGAQRCENGWRVVLTVTDEVGNRWPLTVWVSEGAAVVGNR